MADTQGVLVGNAQDVRAATGATMAVLEVSTVASVATLCDAISVLCAQSKGTKFGGLTGGAGGPPRTDAHGVHEATALPYKTSLPDWRSRHGSR